MWVVGVLLLLAIGAGLVLLIGWRPRASPSPPLWDIPALRGTDTGVVGMLAGFSVAGAIFIASLGPAQRKKAKCRPAEGAQGCTIDDPCQTQCPGDPNGFCAVTVSG